MEKRDTFSFWCSLYYSTLGLRVIIPKDKKVRTKFYGRLRLLTEKAEITNDDVKKLMMFALASDPLGVGTEAYGDFTVLARAYNQFKIWKDMFAVEIQELGFAKALNMYTNAVALVDDPELLKLFEEEYARTGTT